MVEENITDDVLKKLKLNEDTWNEIMAAEPKTYLDYHTSYAYLKAFRLPIKLASSMNIIPQIFDDKYFGSKN